MRINDLQIVNGGQTARTVQQVAEENGQDIEAADVLVRVYELQENDADAVAAITVATNSQNPVVLRDLRANEPRQRALRESISNLGYAYRVKRDARPVAPGEFTSAVVAESVLAIWRRRPHQARFRSREHFGALYETIFSEDLNGAQAVIAALLRRQAENHRKRPPEDAPDFLPYDSRFISMLMGKYLLSDMEIALGGLDHRNFTEARDLLERRARDYLRRAQDEISAALNPLFSDRDRTLQRLSATFRRHDLVEALGPPIPL